MARTTSAAVIGILGNDYDKLRTPSLTGYIDSASAMVDRVYTCSVNKGKGLSSTELELIERWLAAHFYVQMDQTFTSKSSSGASASFQGKTSDEGICGSKYGQAAMRIDYSGCLTVIDKRQVAGGMWLGKPPSQQIPIWERD